MAQLKFKHHYTPEEYLAQERVSDEKSEYWYGQIYAMTGASRYHNLLESNLIYFLRSKLKGKDCNVYPSHMRLKMDAGKAYCYPDVIVTCGKEEFSENDNLLTPKVIFEILSPSTEKHDRTTKLLAYRAIPSVEQYVLVRQDTPMVEVYSRTPDSSLESQICRRSVELSSLEIELSIDEIYQKIDFEI